MPRILYAITCLFISFLFTCSSFSQQLIPIYTQSNALILQVSPDSTVNMLYFGTRLAGNNEYDKINNSYRQGDDYSQVLASAYPSSGTRNLIEPAISVAHDDGNESLDLKYVNTQTKKIDSNVSVVTILLKDPVYELRVELYYRIYFSEDVIEQWSSIQHNEKGKVTLHKYASANLYMKGDKFYLRQYHGNKMREMQPEEALLTHGIKTLDTKLGTRANMFMPSSFMVSLDNPSSEDEGAVLLGTLAYSGNFRLDFEVDYLNNLRIISGINNYASTYQLKPKEKFETPALIYTFSDKGRGEASRRIHRWARRYKLLDGKGPRLTLLNNWEATYFDFNEPKLADLIRDTKKLGVDMFLLDDGWFGNKYPRNDDRAALGDWQENRQKLPHGIGWLVQQAKEQQVKFGLWIEPEMISPKSELYEQHPDWVVKQPQRKEYYYRNQLVLDLANPKVQDFIVETIDGIFTKYPGVAYLKWDCNSIIYNAYSTYLKEQQSHFYIEYYRGLYNVLSRIRNKYPTTPMMLCSGGGGRVDYAALAYFTEYWPSDNTDPLERIFIQWEYSYFYPAISSANHVTDWGKQPLKFKTDVAMMGKPGFDIVVHELNEKDLQFTQQAVKIFNQFKPVIWQGDQFRLSDPTTSDVASVMYIDSDRSSGIMFNYLVNNRYGKGSRLPIKLKELKADKYYIVKEINIYPGKSSTLPDKQRFSGDFLMKIGINPDVKAGRSSVVLQIEEEGLSVQALSKSEEHLYNMCLANADPTKFPRSAGKDGLVEYVNADDWTSGFFPGSLWYMYEHTRNPKFLYEAQKRTAALAKEQYNRSTHDLGFMLFCSYGNGYRITGDTAYKTVLMNGARSLLSRFNKKTGCIRSWDFGKWQSPVIIDNMMNLELLFWATHISGDSSFYKAAVSHARNTMRNHYRPDYSCYHVVDYDTITGQPRKKQTFQGYADSSAWARGQAWGIYGFTMVYRETKDREFLTQAMRCADFVLNNRNLPADKIPYWDFNDIAIPNVSRDASAAAVIAAALLELYQYADNDGKRYKEAALQILNSLSSPQYMAEVHTNNDFILMHSTGNKPAGTEIDKPLNYADYYFIEALMRYKLRISEISDQQ